MKLLEGLLLYEIVLLALGVILFLALVWVLVYSVLRKRGIASLLFFFLLPVVMIGFPAIQKIKFDSGGVEIEKDIKELVEQPAGQTSPATAADLKAKLGDFKARAANSPTALLTIARAETALGDVAQSKVTIDQAIKLNPEAPAAQDFKKRVEKLNVNTHPAILREAVKANAMTIK